MEQILLSAATSADIFAAVISIRISGIKLPPLAAAAIPATGAVILYIACLLSAAADRLISIQWASMIAKAILILLGLYTIFGDYIKNLCRRKNTPKHALLACIEVLNDPVKADIDNSKSISAAEGLFMGIALSADSVFTGISAGIAGMSPIIIFSMSLLFGLIASAGGILAAGWLLNRNIKGIPLERIGGILLIIVAILL